MRKIILFSILIAVLAVFFASSHPDGLEKVAETLGFIDGAVERGGFQYDLFPSMAAIVGLFGLFWVAVKLWPKTSA